MVAINKRLLEKKVFITIKIKKAYNNQNARLTPRLGIIGNW